MPAYANGQKYIYDGGPERQAWSDPDATWGHRSAVSTRKGGGFYGYKLHMAVCTATGLPLAWDVATARQHESQTLPVLLDAVQGRGFQVETCTRRQRLRRHPQPRGLRHTGRPPCDPASRRRPPQQAATAVRGRHPQRPLDSVRL